MAAGSDVAAAVVAASVALADNAATKLKTLTTAKAVAEARTALVKHADDEQDRQLSRAVRNLEQRQRLADLGNAQAVKDTEAHKSWTRALEATLSPAPDVAVGSAARYAAAQAGAAPAAAVTDTTTSLGGRGSVPDAVQERLALRLKTPSVNIAGAATTHDDDAGLLLRISGGRALKGVLLFAPLSASGKDRMFAPGMERLLEVPSGLHRKLASRMSEEKSSEFTSMEAYRRFKTVLEDRGASSAVHMHGAAHSPMVGLNAGLGHDSSNQAFTSTSGFIETETTHYLRCAVKLVYTETFQIERGDMVLAEGARRSLEAVTTQAAAEEFLVRFGSHVPCGLHHVGTVEFTTLQATVQKSVEHTELKRAVNRIQKKHGKIGGASRPTADTAEFSASVVNAQLDTDAHAARTFRQEVTIAESTVSTSDLPGEKAWQILDTELDHSVPVWDLVAGDAGLQAQRDHVRAAWLRMAQRFTHVPWIHSEVSRIQLREFAWEATWLDALQRARSTSSEEAALGCLQLVNTCARGRAAVLTQPPYYAHDSVITAMRNHIGSTDVQSAACMALASLAAHASNVEVLARVPYRAHAEALRVVASHTSTVDAKSNAMLVLTRMARRDAVRQQLLSAPLHAHTVIVGTLRAIANRRTAVSKQALRDQLASVVSELAQLRQADAVLHAQHGADAGRSDHVDRRGRLQQLVRERVHLEFELSKLPMLIDAGLKAIAHLATTGAHRDALVQPPCAAPSAVAVVMGTLQDSRRVQTAGYRALTALCSHENAALMDLPDVRAALEMARRVVPALAVPVPPAAA